MGGAAHLNDCGGDGEFASAHLEFSLSLSALRNAKSSRSTGAEDVHGSMQEIMFDEPIGAPIVNPS